MACKMQNTFPEPALLNKYRYLRQPGINFNPNTVRAAINVSQIWSLNLIPFFAEFFRYFTPKLLDLREAREAPIFCLFYFIFIFIYLEFLENFPFWERRARRPPRRLLNTWS